MSWIAYAMLVIFSSVSYQIMLKFIAGKISIFASLALTGLVLFFVSITVLWKQGELVSAYTQSKYIWVLPLLALTTLGIEFGYYAMYNSGAPLSYARTITNGAIVLLLLGFATLILGEKLTISQYVGVLVTLAGLILIGIKK